MIASQPGTFDERRARLLAIPLNSESLRHGFSGLTPGEEFIREFERFFRKDEPRKTKDRPKLEVSTPIDFQDSDEQIAAAAGYISSSQLRGRNESSGESLRFTESGSSYRESMFPVTPARAERKVRNDRKIGYSMSLEASLEDEPSYLEKRQQREEAYGYYSYEMASSLGLSRPSGDYISRTEEPDLPLREPDARPVSGYENSDSIAEERDFWAYFEDYDDSTNIPMPGSFPTSMFDYEEHESIVPGIPNRLIVQFSGDYHDADWNKRFQRILQVIRSISSAPRPVSSVLYETKVAACFALINLARDFSYAAQTYGKIIIAEAHRKRKRIEPIELGGSLGGTKYVVQHILFKFAVNDESCPLFESDYEAGLVAGHELKGALAYFNLEMDFNVPLMCLVDYLGYRLVCTSILPIDNTTLVSGSADCGLTVKRTGGPLGKSLARAGARLGITPHICGRTVGETTLLSTAIDLEAHVGHDGHPYLVDFSRTFPPEDPAQSGFDPPKKNSHLFRLFRPEFYKFYGKSLCNDTYTQFIMHDPRNGIYQKEVQLATAFLKEKLIVDCAQELDRVLHQHYQEATLHQVKLPDLIHSFGIGLHWCGLLRRHCKREEARTMLLVEMIVRVAKNDFRRTLRQRSKNMGMPTEEPYRRVVIDMLNRLFGSGARPGQVRPIVPEYWNTLKQLLMDKFPQALTRTEMDPLYPLHQILFSFRVTLPGKEPVPARSSTLFQVLRRNCLRLGPQRLREVGIVALFQVTNHQLKRDRRPAIWTLSCKDYDNVLKLGPVAEPDLSVEADCYALAASAISGQASGIRITRGTPEQLAKVLELLRAPATHYNNHSLAYDGKFLLLKGVEAKMGLVWASSMTPQGYRTSALLHTRIIADLEPTPFTGLDILDIKPRVKEMNIVANAQGVVNLHLGTYYGETRNRRLLAGKAFPYLEAALASFKEALKQDPTNYESIVNAVYCTYAFNRYAKELEERGEQNLKRGEEVGEILKTGLRLRPNDSQLLFLAAEILAELKQLDAAEALYLSCLEQEPNRAHVWSRYGRFLSFNRVGDVYMELVARCYERAKEIQSFFGRLETENLRYSDLAGNN